MEIPKNAKIAVFILLFTITLFSIYKYVSALKEKYELLKTLNEVKQQVQILENDKQSLLRELDKEKQLADKLNEQNAGLKENLKASITRLTKLFVEVENNQKSLDDLRAQFSLLKAENEALKDKTAELTSDNETMKAKLSSIAELKKAIREFRRQIGKVGKEIQQKTQEGREILAAGNRGFLVKDGKSTATPKAVKIEVTPAPAPAKE